MSVPSAMLGRGEACAECRRRKLRCDGTKPICVMCSRNDRECIYERPITTPVSILLQDKLDRLEEKLRSLKLRKESSEGGSVVTPGQTRQSSESDYSIDPPERTAKWYEKEQLNRSDRDYLLRVFNANHAQISFQFHQPTFSERLSSSEVARQPHKAVLESMHLLACYFSSQWRSSRSLGHLEEHFLGRARQALTESLAFSDRLVDFMYGSILVSKYLLMRGRYLESYHTHCGAARLALSCGVHRITSNSPIHYPSDTSAAVQLLPPANSPIEVAERIMIFWMIYTTDKLLGLVAGLASALPNEVDEDAPFLTEFPRSFGEYDSGQIVYDGVSNLPGLFQGVPSTLQLPADQAWTNELKGLAILSRTSYLCKVHRSGVPTSHSVGALLELRRHINTMLRNLEDRSPITSSPLGGGISRALTTMCLLTAAIEVNQSLIGTVPGAETQRIEHAQSVAELATCVDPQKQHAGSLVMAGYCWRLAFEVIYNLVTSDAAQPEEEDVRHLTDLVIALERLTVVFPAMVRQVHEVQLAVERLLDNFSWRE